MVDISAPTANLSIYIYEPYYHLSSIKSTEKEANQSAKMVLLDHLWDDVVAGPQPERGLKHLKKVFTQPLNVKGDRFNPHRSLLFLFLLVFLCVIDDLQILILTLFFRIYVYDE